MGQLKKSGVGVENSIFGENGPIFFGFFGHEFARENGILPMFHFTLLRNAA